MCEPHPEHPEVGVSHVHTRGQIHLLITGRTAKGGRNLLPRPGVAARHFVVQGGHFSSSPPAQQRGVTEELPQLCKEWVLGTGFSIPFCSTGLQLWNYPHENGSCDLSDHHRRWGQLPQRGHFPESGSVLSTSPGDLVSPNPKLQGGRPGKQPAKGQGTQQNHLGQMQSEC